VAVKPYRSLAALVPWRQIPFPVDWAGLFGRGAPLEVEVGCGNGEWLIRRAREHPELNLLGVDHSWPSVRRALRKVDLARVPNLLLVQAGGLLALWRLFGPGELERIWVHFPRPWPKEGQESRRLLQARFLRLAASRLRMGGRLRLVTDWRPYLDWALTQVPEGVLAASWRVRGPGLDTKYERKWLARGQQEFYQLDLEKVGEAAWPPWREYELRQYELPDFAPRRFPLGEHLEGGILVSFKVMFYDRELGRALLRCVAVEEELKQGFYLEFLRRERDWLLRVGPGCGVLPTRGVMHSLELARRLALECAAGEQGG